jgi:hypothetical protein
MKKELNLLYLELLKYPNSPKTYRELKSYYAKEGKHHEAKAFDHLLETRFNETPSLYANNPDSDKQQ